MKGIRGSRHLGMSLIEVLVALLVLGIGVMGYAALQLNSVRMTEDTYSRSQAMAIAQDLIERVRSNTEALMAYRTAASWAGSISQPPSTCLALGSLPASDPCTASEMALVDIYETRTLAATMLPTGSIGVQACSVNATCVVVAWSQTTTGACDQSQSVDSERGPNANCVRIEFIP